MYEKLLKSNTRPQLKGNISLKIDKRVITTSLSYPNVTKQIERIKMSTLGIDNILQT